jgi:hypothetical protein
VDNEDLTYTDILKTLARYIKDADTEKSLNNEGMELSTLNITANSGEIMDN